MIKIILQILFCWPDKLRDAEFNIEGLTVKGVERIGRKTMIGYVNEKGKMKNYSLFCTLEKHQDLVNRFRVKIKAPNSKVSGGRPQDVPPANAERKRE
ncbi:MAG: hypothetical protein KGL39_26455 [Patescibacteria group bacterium]|nr:hypothetical protein [Patescibacteria group bacterium]